MNFSQVSRLGWKVFPAILIIIIMLALYKALDLDHKFQHLQEPMPFPEFSLIDIRDNKTVTIEQLKGQVYVAHIWASWCVPCKKEHIDWVELKDKLKVPLVGIIYRDKPEQALTLIKQKGDPYYFLLNDNAGKLGLDLGIIGTPETFVIDKQGLIQFHHVGTLSLKEIENELIPLVNKLKDNI